MTTSNPYRGPFDGLRHNKQPIEKRDRGDNDGFVEVHSIFHTIQGEGPFSGKPAVFVRLAGCNLQCPMCDTEYTEGRKAMHPHAVVDAIERTALHTGGLVVVTGGEPFRQDLTDLLFTLHEAGYYVQVETNGTLPPPQLGELWSSNINSRDGVYIVCSPKTGKVHDDIRHRAACFKYVLTAGAVDPHDGLPTSVLGLTRPPARPCLNRDNTWRQPVYVQPADEQSVSANGANHEAALNSAMKYGYTLQLQIHKHFGIE